MLHGAAYLLQMYVVWVEPLCTVPCGAFSCVQGLLRDQGCWQFGLMHFPNFLNACVQRGAEGGGGLVAEPMQPILLLDPDLAPQQQSHRAAVHNVQFWHAPSKNCAKDAARKVELGGAAGTARPAPALLATCSGATKGSRGIKTPGAEAAIKIWDVAQGVLVRTLVPPEGSKYMQAVRWAPDGRHVTCTLLAPWLCVWCVRTGQVVLQLDMSADVCSVEWSHDGAWLAVGMALGVVELVRFTR